MKPQDRWAEDKEVWAGGSHLYFILIENKNRGRATSLIGFFSGVMSAVWGGIFLLCRGLG